MSKLISNTQAIDANSIALDSIPTSGHTAFHVKNAIGHVVNVPLEFFTLNYVLLFLVMIMAIVVLIHKLDEKMTDFEEWICKAKYISIFICASLGLFYPVKFGMLGLNFIFLIILTGEALNGRLWINKLLHKK
jgi:hypothetical protein